MEAVHVLFILLPNTDAVGALLVRALVARHVMIHLHPSAYWR